VQIHAVLPYQGDPPLTTSPERYTTLLIAGIGVPNEVTVRRCRAPQLPPDAHAIEYVLAAAADITWSATACESGIQEAATRPD
jgi:hypothetical protein